MQIDAFVVLFRWEKRWTEKNVGNKRKCIVVKRGKKEENNDFISLSHIVTNIVGILQNLKK